MHCTSNWTVVVSIPTDLAGEWVWCTYFRSKLPSAKSSLQNLVHTPKMSCAKVVYWFPLTLVVIFVVVIVSDMLILQARLTGLRVRLIYSPGYYYYHSFHRNSVSLSLKRSKRAIHINHPSHCNHYNRDIAYKLVLRKTRVVFTLTDDKRQRRNAARETQCEGRSARDAMWETQCERRSVRDAVRGT